MAPLTVDPGALSKAGTAVMALGEVLAAASIPLATGIGVNTGQDAAGLVFGLQYQASARALLNATAAGINAMRRDGTSIQASASNYSIAEAASTLGGGGHALPAPNPPTQFVPPAPPRISGPGVAAPMLWVVIESFVDFLWPNGDPGSLRTAAGCWRGFGAVLQAIPRGLDGPKTEVIGQEIPEGGLIEAALLALGADMDGVGSECVKLADAMDGFADEIARAQNAIRDILNRLGSLADLWHDATMFIHGDALGEIKKVAADVNRILHNAQREESAHEQALRLGMEVIDSLVCDMERQVRGGLTRYLGEDVGNPVATVFDTYINVEEGILKEAVGAAHAIDQLDPRRLLTDPLGSFTAWKNVDQAVLQSIPAYALVDPEGAWDTWRQQLHVADWSSSRPGLGLGENLFDLATVFVPGIGEGGAAAEGAGAAARLAEAGGDASELTGVLGRGQPLAGGMRGLAGSPLGEIGAESGRLATELEAANGFRYQADSSLDGRLAALPAKTLEVPGASAAREVEVMPNGARGGRAAPLSPESGFPPGIDERPHEAHGVPRCAPSTGSPASASSSGVPIADHLGRVPPSTSAVSQAPTLRLSQVESRMAEQQTGFWRGSGDGNLRHQQGEPSSGDGGDPQRVVNTSIEPNEPYRGDPLANELTAQVRDQIIAMAKGSRPDPTDYLSIEYIDNHLERFNDGATRFVPESNLDKYGIVQRDGTAFVMPKGDADAILYSSGYDLRAVESELGLPEGFLDSSRLVRVDIPDPASLNLRIPSGNEAGANQNWLPGGLLPNGAAEAVIDGDGISVDSYTVTILFY